MGLRSEVLDDFKESFDRASHRFVGMERKSTLPALPPSPPFPIFWLARLRSRLLPGCPSEPSRPRGDPSDPSTQNHARSSVVNCAQDTTRFYVRTVEDFSRPFNQPTERGSIEGSLRPAPASDFRVPI